MLGGDGGEIPLQLKQQHSSLQQLTHGLCFACFFACILRVLIPVPIHSFRSILLVVGRARQRLVSETNPY